MKLVYKGKTKDVHALEDGNYLLTFKDDMTGENGTFDPGANTVGLSVEGAGRAGLALTVHFFELLKAKGVKTHYISAQPQANTMTVLPAAVFGRGVEVICRYRAVGSFMRRYGEYISEGAPLPAYVEFTLKDDERGDPLINAEALDLLGIITLAEHDAIAAMTRHICAIIRDELARLGLELYDIKLEFGRVDGGVCLIDEISGGNMRVFRDGRPVHPLELAGLVLGA